jgi:hypothetical protein
MVSELAGFDYPREKRNRQLGVDLPVYAPAAEFVFDKILKTKNDWEEFDENTAYWAAGLRAAFVIGTLRSRLPAPSNCAQLQRRGFESRRFER